MQNDRKSYLKYFNFCYEIIRISEMQENKKIQFETFESSQLPYSPTGFAKLQSPGDSEQDDLYPDVTMAESD